MTDAFTRTHAATIRKLVVGLEGKAKIEVGIRTTADGRDTADSTAWAEDVDLQDMCKLHDLPKAYPLMLTEGTTLDLYVSTMQDHGDYGLKCNYTAQYVGCEWHIIDQFHNVRVA
jgi:hypothetical protein